MNRRKRTITRIPRSIVLYGTDGQPVPLVYTLSVSSQRHTTAIRITPEENITVYVPESFTEEETEEVIHEQGRWILATLEEQRRKRAANEQRRQSPDNPDQILLERERGTRLIRPAIATAIARYEPLLPAWHRPITRITIREQQTRWGSCSQKGGLNFNWKLINAPQEVLEYVVVHELCHLCYMNHQAPFWHLVEELMPDYRTWRAWLRQHGSEL